MYPAKTVQKTNSMLSKPTHEQGHKRPSSTTSVSTCNSCSQKIPSPPSPSSSQHRHSSSSNTRRARHPPQMPRAQDVNHDLNDLIDEHIAWTQGTEARQRRESQGTMIVDWDGTGTPVVSWRKRGDASNDDDDDDEVKEKRKSKPPPPAPLNIKPLPDLPLTYTPTSTAPSYHTTVLSSGRNPPQSPTNTPHPVSPLIPPPPHQPPFTALYHPPRYSPTTQTHHAPYVAGYDAKTHFSYDYDGRIVHVHRRGGQQHDKSIARLSAHSDYYTMDLEKYQRGIEVRVAEGDGEDEVVSEGGGSTQKQKQKQKQKKEKNQGSVGKFAEKVLYPRYPIPNRGIQR
ncbi:hypothetical protein PTNB29_03524 [Pyrenophora teres f. teres]|nr:hypothetical protein PTNB29_03524 [Pyrenophora teres f. teres]